MYAFAKLTNHIGISLRVLPGWVAFIYVLFLTPFLLILLFWVGFSSPRVWLPVRMFCGFGLACWWFEFFKLLFT